MTVAEYRAAGRVLCRLVVTPGPLDTECWINPGSRSGRYAMVRVGGQVMLAHRLLYRIIIGEPVNAHLHHRCETVTCANPHHLADIPPATHIRLGDSLPGRRARQTHCGRGHRFTKANTYVDRNGWRRCRACHRAEDTARRNARRAA